MPDPVTGSRMAAEIREQPAALEATLHALVGARAELSALRLRVDRVLFFARGSSHNAATYGRYLCETVAGLPAALGAPSVATLYGARLDLRRTLVVVVSQSGRTEELLEVVDWATRCGGLTLGVTNDGDSPLAGAARHALVTAAGPEQAVPATKTYTTALLTLAVLTELLTPVARPFGDALHAVPEQAEALLAAEAESTAVAATLARVGHLSVVSRGITLTTAAEVALKVEEACGIPTSGLSSADLQHGPVAIVGAGATVLVAAPPEGPPLEGLTALAGRARGLGARVLGLGGDATFRGVCEAAMPAPDLPETLAPIVGVIPGQLMTEALARARGLDPDRPRGLTKVTQTA